MIEHLNIKTLTDLTRRTAVAFFIVMSASSIAYAGESGTTKMKIFTFVGTSTEDAIRNKDYDGIIHMSQRVSGHFGYHDLVNLCAAYAFKEQFELAGDSLKRAPKGYDPDHPLIEDLRRKDFIAVSEWETRWITRPDFFDRFTRTCRAAKPFMAYLTKACGLNF